MNWASQKDHSTKSSVTTWGWRKFARNGYRNFLHHFNVSVKSTVVRHFWKIATKIQRMFWWYCDTGRDMNTSLRSIQPKRSKDLEETRQKDTNPRPRVTLSKLSWPLSRLSSRRFSTTWYYNQWSTLRVTPSPVTFFYLEATYVWCIISSRQRTCSQVQHDTGFIKLIYPVYSSDPAPSDYYLFSNLKNFLRSTNFESANDRKSQS